MEDIYAIHLRKSRADIEAERRGEGETLSRHLATLTEYAQRAGLRIGKIYREIASADSIDARPEALQMLKDVQAGMWRGVLCMDLDRLSRGGSADQDRVLRTFYISDTLIITPGKTYDLTQPNDEDFSEMKFFFARLEYKTIKRRLYKGRERSAKDGWYLGTKDPYGYRRVRKTIHGRTGPTLEPVPEQVETVNQIFTWYASGHSSHTIADMLNASGLRTNSGGLWTPSTIRGMLHNVLYIGYVSWGKRVAKPTIIGDNVLIKRPQNPDAIIVPAKHPGIVPEPLWEAVRARLESNGAPPVQPGNPLVNPLGGLVYCARCGWSMQRHHSRAGMPATLRCYNRECDQISAPIDAIERHILQAIDAEFFPSLPLSQPSRPSTASIDRQRRNIIKQIDQTKAQQGRLHDLLERGVYSVDEFLARREELSKRLAGLQERLDEIKQPEDEQKRLDKLRGLIPASLTAADAYNRATTPELKNQLLKAIIERVEYDKTEKRRGKYDADDRGLSIEVKFRI